ncbi:MAG: isoleucine--tRNA ligase [Deltaproteobacteria bacterium]|nr:MAG: isoleucine--tRNA ligase [Deltaproteobacteria bacterium]
MFDRLPSPAKLEDQILDLWDRERIFERSLERAQGREPFVFFEGPPTANGLPHNGHVLTRVIKDVIPRYKTMRGHLVRRKAGWDTHGLPVEIEVQKAMGLKGRQGILDHGMANFNRACRDSVFRYVEEWDTLTRQIGFWVDLDDPYVTFHREYVESVWWALSRLLDKGLLYQGHKVVWWWPQGGTTLSAAEVGLGYREVDDPAITVRFRDVDDPSTSYLAWTTTPWTLPSNVALAVGESISYARCADPDGGTVILAADLAESYDLEILDRLPASALLGRRYTPLYDFGPPTEGEAFVIVSGEHVTTDAGTGIVHTAPAFGEDDMKVAERQGLGLLQHIRPDGTFGPNTPWDGVFCKDADRAIIAELRERGLLFKRDAYRHDYPFSYRADDEPLIQYARPTWFIRTTAVIDAVIENNRKIAWLPEHIRDGRFGDFLRNNVDWALSRERFWGTPLNLWICEDCGQMRAPASLTDLEDWGAQGIDHSVDEHLRIHRPWIDQVTLPCTACAGTQRRVPEVIDCWFDSGCMPFAQWGFPHKGLEAFREQFPADFISEAIDQTRGWFYSLLMIGTLLFDEETVQEYDLAVGEAPVPYKSCVVLGHVSDVEGRKESKSKGNYTSPNLVLRGTAKLFVLPDPELKPGTVGLKPDQVRSLELGAKERVTLSSAEAGEGRSLTAKVVSTEVGPKDSCHLHPDDIATLELDGTVWFTLPGEAPGADAFRWLFCASNPPWSKTRLSMRNIREGQREFLIRLRNVYQFFSIYADIAYDKGSFDPRSTPPRPPSARPALDRWILDQLARTTAEMTEQLDGYGIYGAARALLRFVDDLSNWYVRRSRARFWSEGDELADALWTLYEVLVHTARLLAPFVPFTAEALWRELVVGAGRTDLPPSVHLADWPEPQPLHLDPALHADMALVRQLASLGLAARTASKVKVRQPLQAISVVLADPSRQPAVEALSELLSDELNVREIRFATDASTFVNLKLKPDYKKLGRRLGKDMKACAAALAQLDPTQAKTSLDQGSLGLELGDGRHLELTPEEVIVQVEAQGTFEAASSPEAVVALHTEIDQDLRAEGFVRELTSRVQGVRKQLDLGFTQRIELWLSGDPNRLLFVNPSFFSYLARECLVRGEPHLGADAPEGVPRFEVNVDGEPIIVGVRAL